MKSVLISIRPKWCSGIIPGEKTVEVRKNKPMLDTPFKCYIYCTKDYSLGEFYASDIFDVPSQGKVIGEFVCDKVVRFENDIYDEVFRETSYRACVPMDDLMIYLGRKDYGYGWHISDLVIYDEPKGLSEFVSLCKAFSIPYKCCGCEYYFVESNEDSVYEQCNCDTFKPLKKPPQSWCYVYPRLRKETE